MLTIGVLASAAAAWFAGCGSSGDDESPAATATPGASPPASATALPTATATPLPATRVELPRDESGHWVAEELIQGKHVVLVEWYRSRLDDYATNGAEIGFMDLDSGEVTSFRKLPAGEQISDPDNDGRFLAWAEVGIMGVAEMRWRVMVMDLESGEVEEIDALPEDVDPPGSGYGTPLAVDGGRLVYGALIADGTETVQELRLRDLASGVESVIQSQPLSEALVSDVSLSGDSLLTVQREATVTDEAVYRPYALNLADLAAGRQQLARVANRTSIASDGQIIATLPNGIAAGRLGGELEQVYTCGAVPFDPTAIPGGGFWVDPVKHRALALNPDGSVGELSPEYTLRVFSDGDVVAWLESPGRGDGRGSGLVVAWRELQD